MNLIPPLKKSQNPPNVDMNKYCRYHLNRNHTIDECATLRDKVEKLICVGYQKQFVRQDKEGGSRIEYKMYDDHRRQER